MSKLISLYASFFLLFAFTGCGQEGGSYGAATELFQKVSSEQSLNREVTFQLATLAASEKEITVQVVLHNPSGQTLSGVRSWVSFPAEILKGLEIEPAPETFALTAPGEDEFENAAGVAMIGGSLLPEVAESKTLPLATLRFERLRNQTVALSFFDAREGGHTDALILRDGTPRSVLNVAEMEPLVLPIMQ